MPVVQQIIRKDLIKREFQQLGASRSIWLDLAPANENTNTSYSDVDGSEILINFDDFAGYKMYLELQGNVDGGTGSFQLYNVTDSAAISSSEVTTSGTTVGRIRSSEITKPIGQKTLKLQSKITGGGMGDKVYQSKTRIVFELE